MHNHVHFIAVPEKKQALTKCFASAHVKYTRRINARNKWKGYLWQGRYVSKVLDERHLLASVRYIERNPIEAGIVRYPWDYEWSSAAYHTGMSESDLLVKDDGNLRGLIDDWKRFLKGDTHSF
jgi:putative transposase